MRTARLGKTGTWRARWKGRAGVIAAAWLAFAARAGTASGGDFASLADAGTREGYLARLLINETPFPGERGWVSEADTKDAMLSVLWVLESRRAHVPEGYRQSEVGAVESTNLVDFITARKQCQGFWADSAGVPAMDPRVEERIAYLLKIANSGKAPGRFAGLVNHAGELARRYYAGEAEDDDLFAGLETVGGVAVTGRAYSWMTGQDVYHPGGSFVKIPDALRGLLGGNRFFTLEKRADDKEEKEEEREKP
ncbi:MAG: hypothetical protein IK066_05515 [Kiritimatiellae bacterium]|nr:hypothetical protein [Kiritimatiellia bacterium]